MLVLILLATWMATWIGVALFLRRKGFSTGFGLSGGFVVSCGVLALGSMMLMEQTKDAAQTNEPQRTQLTAQKPDRLPFQKKAPENKNTVTARQDSNPWSVPAASDEPACIDKAAVIVNTPSGPYLINGAAVDRYGNTYKGARDMGRPVPELKNNPQGKLPPPHELMQYGLKVCD